MIGIEVRSFEILRVVRIKARGSTGVSIIVPDSTVKNQGYFLWVYNCVLDYFYGWSEVENCFMSQI